MPMRVLACLLVVLAVAWVTPAAAADPAFSRAPAVTRTGDKICIDFAVDREADVAVYIENADGGIVRHLAAGVLGKNPPEPLKAGSLDQSIEWDGKDDAGKPAVGAPFKAQVCLGLAIRYAGIAFSDKPSPANLVDVMGMAVGPDGRLYVLAHRWIRYVAFSTAVHVFRRDGSYERTIKPFPSDTTAEAVRPTGAFWTTENGLVPLIYRALWEGPRFYPNFDIQHQPVVMPDGKLVLAVAPGNLAILDRDGGIPGPTYAGPRLVGQEEFTAPLPNSTGGFVSFNMPYLAVDSQAKNVYLTGIGKMKSIPNAGGRAFNDHALYRAPFPQRGPAEPVFGDPAAAANDDKHLNDPRGVAVDGRGHVLVADLANNRVVVLNEKDMAFAGAFPVEAPFWVAVHRKTGAIYVGARQTSVLKFSSWPNPVETARTDFAALLAKIYVNRRAATPLHLALDDGADKPLLWAACGGLPLRMEDQGSSFSEPQPIAASESIYPWNLSTDPLRREVSCQLASNGALAILDEAAQKVAQVRGVADGSRSFRLGPDGLLYGQHHWGATKLARFDRAGKQVPFPATADNKELKGALDNRPEGTTYWPRDFGLDPSGNIYVKNRSKEYHGLMTVEQYGPDGSLKRTAIWASADGALGPRIDRQGNLYMAEVVKPVGQPYPELFKGRLVAGTIDGSSGFTLQSGFASMDREYSWMYGSVIKYGPKGGAVWFPNRPQPFDGECKLDPTLAKQPVIGMRGANVVDGVELQGALWLRPGYAYLADMAGSGTDRCHCTASDFDVDPFGRVFFPNQGLFRVEVLDTNGNFITSVGGYGNQDCCGPDSYVLDPAGNFFRPRQAGDPKDLLSPFAKPEMAFNWFTGMAVTDKYLYVADGNNRRVLRGLLGYATTAMVAVP